MNGTMIRNIFDSMINNFANTFIEDIDYRYPSIFSHPLERWSEKLTDLVTVELNVTGSSWENFLSNLFNITVDDYITDHVTKNTLFRWYLYQDPTDNHQITINFKTLIHEFYLSRTKNTKCYINFLFLVKGRDVDTWHICEFINIDLYKRNPYSIDMMDTYHTMIYDPKIYPALSDRPVSELLKDNICQSIYSINLSDPKREFSFYIPQTAWTMFGRTLVWGIRLFII